MIPKIIHYCWFGKKDKPVEVCQYIERWKSRLLDYQIIEWNEDNFDITYNKYVAEAYENRKFAFVSDVSRLYALYNFGGIYLDTDIEIMKSFDDILETSDLILGFENGGQHIMTAFIAASRENAIIKEFSEYYTNRSFILENGQFDISPNTDEITKIISRLGGIMNNTMQKLASNVYVYPEEYFSAFEFKTFSKISTEHTYTVHHFHASWLPKYVRVRFKLKKIVIKIIGKDSFLRIKRLLN